MWAGDLRGKVRPTADEDLEFGFDGTLSYSMYLCEMAASQFQREQNIYYTAKRFSVMLFRAIDHA